MDEMLARADEFYTKHPELGVVHNYTDALKWMAAFARSECLLQMEDDAKLVCWQADNCHERGVHTAACDAIREAMKKLQVEMEATR